MLEHIKDEYLEGVRNEFKSRRDARDCALKEIPDVAIHKPQGAFYSVVQLPVDNRRKLCRISAVTVFL